LIRLKIHVAMSTFKNKAQKSFIAQATKVGEGVQTELKFFL
jgi:hypothetical protein